eukprot:TRINITY_DN8166_c0_g5_i6.p1 TRINITY_DN8166_c0_g5~~TRINITY_DN8166_c0_g5_i6.p1  ORF type:complete len:162 (+),score=47.62 TRINITY_DN8166_c0_g5_i6:127-612(+)
MRYLLLILLITSSAAMTTEDLRNLTSELLTAININEPHKALLDCLDTGVGEDWEAMSLLLHETVWNDLQSLMMKFIEFNMPPFSSLKSMLWCSTDKQRIKNVIDRMDEQLSDFGGLATKIMNNWKKLVGDLKEYLAVWDKKDYAGAGKIAGKVIRWFFLRP